MAYNSPPNPPAMQTWAERDIVALDRLPEPVRCRIFEIVLRVRHPLYLFQDSPTRVELFAPEKPRNWHGLLRINKRLGLEASAVLYSKNTFILTVTSPREADLLETFLRCIGPKNASFLEHLCISFPAVELYQSDEPQADSFRLRQDSARVFALLKDQCTSLSTLELCVHSKNCDGMTSTSPGQRQHIPEMLSYVERHFREMQMLGRIIIKISSGDLLPETVDAMRGHGWVIAPGRGH